MMRRIAISGSLCAAAMFVASSACAADYPFVGRWNCEVATFTFTNSTYNNGSEILHMTRVVKKGTGYELYFPKNYVVMLSGIKANSMGWLSGASGDGFNCKRVK